MTKSSHCPNNNYTDPANTQMRDGRRRIIKITAAAALTGLQMDLMQALAAVPEDLRPQRGDRLVLAGADGIPKPLKLDDIKAGAKPLHAFPFDAASGTVRNGSRFNKVLLVRLDPAMLDEDTRKRSANGVLAFSAVCTHEGCDVSEWVAKENALLCFCHFSKFSPLEAGRVISGPAQRSLPYLPLALNNGELTVAGPFSAAPGAKKAG
jgi:Rieske Fe-S protein